MKAIMISIKPEWVEKILNGKKTIEIRKTMPKCKLPVKVYIYCTNSNYRIFNTMYGIEHNGIHAGYLLNGKVVAEFILEEVETLWQNHKDGTSTAHVVDKDIFERLSCMTWEQYCEYHKCKNGKYPNSYAWHIDDLKIYDEPKELEGI